ncbi:MAG: HEAT repeat domain-containing protein, partial [bacterium]|nr:HEAT repeat domain-containing protein [bacterium]
METTPSAESKLFLAEMEGLFRDFMASLKVLGLYPPSHPAVLPAVERIFGRLVACLKDRGALEFGITEKELLLKGEGDERWQVETPLAALLHRQGILTMKIDPELTFDELAIFLKELSALRDMASSQNSISATIKNLGVTHLALTMVDYRGLMQGDTDLGSGEDSRDLWRSMIEQATKGNSDAIRRLADLLKVPEGFESLRSRVKEHAVALTGGAATGQHAQLFAEIHQQVFTSLSKDERRDYTENLAAMMVEGTDQKSDVADDLADTFLQFPDGMLMEILASAIVRAGEVDSRLTMAFHRLLSHEARAQSLLSEAERGISRGRYRGFSADVWEQAKSLILSGGEEQFMSKEYHQVLDDLTKYHLEELKTTLGQETLAGIQKALQASELQARRREIFSDLTRTESRPEELHHLLISVRAQLMEYARQGDISRVVDLLKQTFRPGEEVPAEKKAQMQAILFKDGEDSWMPYLLEEIGTLGEEDLGLLQELFNCNREGVTRALVYSLGEERSLSGRKRIANLLIHLGSATVPYLVNALKDSRWYLVRNVVMILGKIGDPSCLRALVPLLRHPQFQVPREVLNVLPELGGDEAVLPLRQILYSKAREV